MYPIGMAWILLLSLLSISWVVHWEVLMNQWALSVEVELAHLQSTTCHSSHTFSVCTSLLEYVICLKWTLLLNVLVRFIYTFYKSAHTLCRFLNQDTFSIKKIRKDKSCFLINLSKWLCDYNKNKFLPCSQKNLIH